MGAGTAILIAHGTSQEGHDVAFERLGRAAPRVAYVGAANGDDPRWFAATRARLYERYGAQVEHARLIGAAALELAAARAALAEAEVLYFAGGDVSVVARRFAELGLAERVRERHAAGALLIGVSAG